MKTIKKMTFAAAVLLAALAAGGCSDFLDVKPKGKDVPEKWAHYNGLLNSTNMTNFTYIRTMETGTGLMQSAVFWPYMCDENFADQASFQNMSENARRSYSWAADIFENDDYCAEYQTMYQQLYIYNMIISEVMDSSEATEAEKRQLLAEARANRAFNYYLLTQFFAKPYNEATADTDLCVPLVTKANSSESSFSRATVKTIYDFVVSELEEACPDLGDRTRHRLRVDKAAGYIFLGKAYMAMYRYSDAAEAFRKAKAAMANASVELGLLDYNVKLAAWGHNPEKPWAWVSGYPNNMDATNTEIIFNKQASILNITFYFYNPFLYIKPEALALYEAEDLRLAFFVNKNYLETVDYPHYRRSYPRSSPNMGADMPEFYLQYAECLARTDKLTEARELVTTLREHRLRKGHAAIPAAVDSKDKLIKFIVEEKHREYMGMGHRWFDMRRLWNDPLFQDLKTGYTHPDGTTTHTLTEDRLVYRIPPIVLNYHPEWTDNN